MEFDGGCGGDVAGAVRFIGDGADFLDVLGNVFGNGDLLMDERGDTFRLSSPPTKSSSSSVRASYSVAFLSISCLSSAMSPDV